MTETKLNYIAGDWVPGATEIENRNPSDLSDLVGLYTQASATQLDDALEAAAQAQAEWAAYGMELKQAVLMNIGNELMARAEELGTLLSREEGKPLAEGKGEVYRAGQFFTYYAAECLRQLGENADSVRAGVEIDVRREPVGVVAVISPWNFPIATASWKIAPALCYGNAVIWKPANATPASAVAPGTGFASTRHTRQPVWSCSSTTPARSSVTARSWSARSPMLRIVSPIPPGRPALSGPPLD